MAMVKSGDELIYQLFMVSKSINTQLVVWAMTTLVLALGGLPVVPVAKNECRGLGHTPVMLITPRFY